MQPSAVGIYVRISEDRDGDGLGVARQLQDCAQYAERKGWQVTKRYVDNDVSAYGGKPRPAYRRMLADIRDRRIEGLIVWHLDRLHRHPRELEEFLDACDAAGICNLATVTGEIDLGTHDGKFHARILSAVARKESDDKSRRTKRKHLEIAQAGRWAGGRPPYGYDVERRIVSEQAAVIREAARRLVAGETLWSVSRDFNARYIPAPRAPRWSGHTLKQVVIHPRNIGLRTLRGEVVGPAVWEPILEAQQFKRLRALLTDPARRTTRPARRYLLSSMLYCRLCSAKLVARPSRRQPGYACATGPGFFGCGRLSILADTLESFITEAIFHRLDGPELASALHHQPDADTEAAELELGIAEDEAQLEQLAGMWASKSISLQEYLAARKVISARLDTLRSRFGRVDRLGSLRALAGQSDKLRRDWPNLNLDQRRAIVGAVLDRVIVGPAQRGLNRFDPNRLDPVWRV